MCLLYEAGLLFARFIGVRAKDEPALSPLSEQDR